MKFEPADIIVMGLVFLLIMIISGLIISHVSAHNTPLSFEGLDLLLAFSGTIVTGVLMYVTKNKND